MFIERFVEKARHIEVQVVGDGTGLCIHLYERDCSVQRRYQKVVELAPAQHMSAEAKAGLYAEAVKLCSALKYKGAGTVEFLVDSDVEGGASFFFMEVNPRLQVEHTVTEELTGIGALAAPAPATRLPLLTPLTQTLSTCSCGSRWVRRWRTAATGRRRWCPPCARTALSSSAA